MSILVVPSLVATPPDVYAPLPVEFRIVKCVESPTTEIVQVPFAAVLPRTPAMVTSSLTEKPWAADVATTMGAALVAPEIVACDGAFRLSMCGMES